MLELLRKKAQSPLIQGTILIIALVFIFWGVGGYRGSVNSVAQVNKEPITYEQFQQAYEGLTSQYREQFGGGLPKGLLENLDLEGQAIEQLIQRALLRQGAKEMGIMVSDLEVQQAIEKMEAFKTNGIFNVEQYEKIITSSGMTPTSFEETMRTDLLAGKVLEYLSRFAKVTPLEVKGQFNYTNEKILLEYVAFSSLDFKDRVDPDDEQLQQYYEENRENYKTRPQVKLHFLTFPYETEDKPEISTEEIEEYYRKNLNRYSVPEKRSARHILIKTAPEDTEDVLAEKRTRIEQLLELARSGEDFAELAKQYSEGPSGPEGGDLGSFSRGRMVKPFEDAVFMMEEGGISDIVETQFGFHIIKLEKIQPAYTRTLAEVKSEITARLQSQRSQQHAFSQASEAYENIILAGSLDKFSQNNDMPIKETDFFPRNSPEKSGFSAGMLTDPAFLDSAFSLNEGELSSLVETGKGYAIIFAAARKEPEIASFADVRERVRQDYISATATTLAREAAEDMLGTLKEKNADFDAAAAEHNLTPETSDYITRDNASGAALPQPMVNKGFELSAQNPYPDEVVNANGIFYVFRITDRKTPSPDLLATKEDEFKAGLLERKKSAILSSWLANVRDKAEIVINEQFL